LTFERGTPKWYVDGALTSNVSMTFLAGASATPDTRDTVVGCTSDLTEWANGAIDELRFYSRVLDATEIAALAKGSALLVAHRERRVSFERAAERGFDVLRERIGPRGRIAEGDHDAVHHRAVRRVLEAHAKERVVEVGDGQREIARRLEDLDDAGQRATG